MGSMFSISRGVLSTLVLALALSACGPVKFSTTTQDSETGGGPTEPTGPGVPTTSLRDVHYNNTVTSPSNKLDIVLIVDDSNSMLADNQKLGAKLADFVTRLQSSSINWQMCVGLTRANSQGVWGASVYWTNYTPAAGVPQYILKAGTPNLSTIFNSTMTSIGAGHAGTDDERAIKTAYHHVYQGDYISSPGNNSGCYRSGAAIAYIIISDEDERSIGGDLSQKYYSNEGLPLEEDDKPEAFVNYVKATFGSSQRFTVNSIIVKPGDTACMQEQDAGGSKSHYGFRYAELSDLTGGGIASICASNFSDNLNLFFSHIQDSLSSVPLECAPVDGNVAVTITPSAGAITSTLNGTSLSFSPSIPAGYNLDLKYKCAGDDRTPSSTGGAKTYQPGFFARIVNFFKSLF